MTTSFAKVRFLVGGGPHVVGGPEVGADVPAGGIIGRSPYATLTLDDPCVSEAHALVSSRAGVLRLLALRRRFSVDGVLVDDIQLEVGQTITLAPGVTLEVLELWRPGHVTVLDMADGTRIIVSDTLFFHGEPAQVSAKWVPDAKGVLWLSGHELRFRAEDEPERVLPLEETATAFEVSGQRFEVQRVANTAGDSTLPYAEVVMRIDDDRVELRAGARRLVLDGIPARFLIALARSSEALGWASLASAVWPDEPNWDNLRRRLDVTLSRIRKKLREHELPADILRTVGQGHFSLALTVSEAP